MISIAKEINFLSVGTLSELATISYENKSFSANVNALCFVVVLALHLLVEENHK